MIVLLLNCSVLCMHTLTTNAGDSRVLNKDYQVQYITNSPHHFIVVAPLIPDFKVRQVSDIIKRLSGIMGNKAVVQIHYY